MTVALVTVIEQTTTVEISSPDFPANVEIVEQPQVQTVEVGIPGLQGAGDPAAVAALDVQAQAWTLRDYKIFSGQYYNNCPVVAGSSSLVMAVGGLRLSPMPPLPYDMTIDRFGISVPTTASSSGTHAAKLGVYEQGSDTVTFTRVADFGEVTGLDTTGLKEKTGLNFTFQKGKIYWLAMLGDHNATIRVFQASVAPNLGTSNTGGTNYQSILRTSQNYASGLPATFTYASGDRSSAVPVLFLMRAA